MKTWFKNNKKKISAIASRAIRTIAQTAVSMITVGQMVTEVDWLTILSVSITAGLVSVLTSIAGGTPEVEVGHRDGNAIVQTFPDGEKYLKVELNNEDVNDIKNKEYIRMRVKQENVIDSHE